MSKMMDKMIILGAVQIAGVRKDGNFTYSLNGSVKDILPELYKVHLDNVHEQMMHFWELGYLEFVDMDRAAPQIKLTPMIFTMDSDDRLSDEDYEALLNLMQIFRKN
jgi:hypothetical protein